MKLLTQAEFISLFPHTRFRYIHDVTKVVMQGSDVLDLSWNKRGYGVFFTVNGFPSTGSADQAHLVSLNGNYVDFDVAVGLSYAEKDKLIQETLMAGMEAGVPAPTIINRTQKGAHLIWLYPEPMEPTAENIAQWREVQKRLVRCFKGDRNPVDPSRVLRLPYTQHLKDPSRPFEITVTSYKPDARFTLGELDMAAPKYAEEEISGEKTLAKDLLEKGVKVGEGQRHMAIAQVVGLLLKDVTTPEQLEAARLALYGWDRTVLKSPEPFSQRKSELDNTLESIWKRELVSRATGANPTRDFAQNLRVWTISEILAHDFGEEQWIVESLITKQGITALSGNPGDFKTWVTIHIALCVSRNIPVFGKFPTMQGNVLIIDEEDHLRLIKGRLDPLGAKDTDTIHYLSQSGFKADNDKALAAIVEIVKEKQIKLVILDSLVRIHDQEENDASGMSKVFSSIQKIIVAGASILFTHHHRKQSGFSGNSNPGQNMRGSSDILAAVDSHITIERKRGEEDDRLIIRQPKSRQGEALKPFELIVLKVERNKKQVPSGFEYVGDFDEKKIKAEEVAEALAIVLADGMKSREVIHEGLKADGFGKTAIDDGLKIAKDAGKIERVPSEELLKEERRKAYYRLPGTSSITLGMELPVSHLYRETGIQEDEETEADYIEADYVEDDSAQEEDPN